MCVYEVFFLLFVCLGGWGSLDQLNYREEEKSAGWQRILSNVRYQIRIFYPLLREVGHGQTSPEQGHS